MQGQTDCSTSMFVYSVISLKFAGLYNNHGFTKHYRAADGGQPPGLHYQSFCDHSRNFAQVNSKF